MGKIKLNVLILIVLGGLSFQKVHCAKHTVISGSIKNVSVYPSVKEFTVHLMDFRGKDTEYTGKIKSDGSFTIEFEQYIAQDIEITPIIGRVLAHPGDNIKLYVDFANIGTILYDGDGQQANRELSKFLNSNNSVVDYSDPTHSSLELFKTRCDSVLNTALKKRDIFINSVRPCEEVRQWTKNYVYTAYYKRMLNYPFSYMMENKLKGYDWLPSPQSSYFNFIENMETMFNNKLMLTDAYELLGFYTSISFNQHFKSDYNEDDAKLSFILDLSKNSKNDIFKQLVLGHFFYSGLNQNNPNLYEKNKAVFDANIQEPFIRLPLESYYATLKANILNPKTASDAIFARMYNKTGENILETIVKENKGKVICIDIWSTGCGPCIAEFPSTKKLMEQYSGKNIKFVFICFGADKEKGEKIMEKAGLGGDHYYLNSSQYSTLQKGLKFNGLPNYVFINKLGQITTSNSLLRPSNPETIKIIDNLLNDK